MDQKPLPFMASVVIRRLIQLCSSSSYSDIYSTNSKMDAYYNEVENIIVFCNANPTRLEEDINKSHSVELMVSHSGSCEAETYYMKR